MDDNPCSTENFSCPSATAVLCVGFIFNNKPVVESSELFAGSRSLIIRHDNQEYCLETTRNGKLILKK